MQMYKPDLANLRTNIVAFAYQQTNSTAFIPGFNQPGTPGWPGKNPGLVAVDHFGTVLQTFRCSSPTFSNPKLFLGYNTTTINMNLENPDWTYSITGGPNTTCRPVRLSWNPYLCSEILAPGGFMEHCSTN